MAHWRDGGIGNMAGSDDREASEFTLREKLAALADGKAWTHGFETEQIAQEAFEALEDMPRWRPLAEAEPLVIKDRYFPFKCLIQTASGYVHGGTARWQNVGGRGSLYDPRLELRWYAGAGQWLKDAKYWMPFPKPRKD